MNKSKRPNIELKNAIKTERARRKSRAEQFER